jgi:hypothetical protein
MQQTDYVANPEKERRPDAGSVDGAFAELADRSSEVEGGFRIFFMNRAVIGRMRERSQEQINQAVNKMMPAQPPEAPPPVTPTTWVNPDVLKDGQVPLSQETARHTLNQLHEAVSDQELNAENYNVQ